jgi:hypothetical protein
MLASAETPSVATLLRAGRHLSKSGDGTALRTLFGKLVETARGTGDARPPAVFAAELTSHGKAATAPELIASLSLAQRYGIRRSWIGAGAALAGALLIGSLALLAARDGTREPDQILLLGELGGWLTKPVIQVPLRRDDWPDGVEIDLERTPRLPPRRRAGQTVGQLAVSPDGKTWLYGMETGDSNTVDVVVDREGEPVRKILYGPRDDGQGSWLPDGAGFAGVSARWSPRGADDYDGVIVSVPDGSVRRITSSRDHDSEFLLSPDGTRFVWNRRYRGTGRPELCWNHFDATAEDKCYSPTGSLGLDLAGWAGTEHVIFLDRADTNARLFSIDLRTERLELLEARATSAKTSPDGRWLAVHALREGRALPAWYVYPALEPARARPLPLGNRSYRYDVAWGAARDRRYLESVAVLGPDSVDLGTAMRFRADGMDASRRRHTIPVTVSWSTSDTTLATIDSSGTLTPRTAGVVRVRASAGGWRTGVRAVHLVTRSFRIVEQESWQEGVRKRWVPFGDPPPDLAKGPDGIMAFWNRGDGSFSSGAYSRFSLDGAAGAGVEALVSTPLTRDQWQQLQISLAGGLDSASAAGWDHRTGGGPLNTAEAGSQCGFSYPTGEGEAGHGVASLHGGGQNVGLAAPGAMKDGTWFRIRVQIFPDGTCGLAMNGNAVARTSAPVDLVRPFVVLLGSSSADTRILVGALEAWEGIRPGVDWEALRRK